MNHLNEVQQWLRYAGLDGIVIPSTDEFLSEFAPPANRRLQWVTGFRGSTGLGVVLQNAAAVFLDGRYLNQGAAEIDATAFAIEPAGPVGYRAWLARSLSSHARIGFDPWLHAASEKTQWQDIAVELGFELQILAENPIDALWGGARPCSHQSRVVDYPVTYAGEMHEAKCASLVEHVRANGLQALLVADPEDVSWLLNVRTAGEAIKVEVGEWHIVPACLSRALIWQDGRVTWFVDAPVLTAEVAARSSKIVTVAAPSSLVRTLREAALRGTIGADMRRTSAALAAVVQECGELRNDDTVARRRWCKHPVELEAARRAHVIDAVAVVRFMAWLTRTVPRQVVTEFEAAEKLQQLRAEHHAFVGPSMPTMSASGLSGAQPHYVPRRDGCRRLNDHSIYWMDSGGQYLGGTTDNTITLALGPPQSRHVLAHTLVLQGFIALATARAPIGTHAFRIDPLARQALWREGMDYAHGTGHGVGNYLNIHEGPVFTREVHPLGMIPLELGMILTNEPAYYAAGDFGLRIESHMVVRASQHRGYLEFETISRLPIDPKLVDFNRMSHFERQWLADYHHTVLSDLEPLLDTPTGAWLRELVGVFARAAELQR